MTRMKESGIDWIGQIPEEWEVDFVNHIFEEHKQKNKGNKEKNLLSLSYGRIIRKSIDTSFGLLPESFDTYNIIQRGDIVLRLTDLQNDKRSLRVGLARENGIITSAYLTLRLKNLESNDSYMYYLLHTYDICKVFYNFGGGVRQGGTWSDIYKMELLIPPKNEQQKIADFLDKKTAQLDKVKDLLEEQIQKLKDYRASLIYETVTNGLDKTVPMKDSGINWIGQVPEGWGVKRLKYLVEISTGTSNTQDRTVESEGYPFFVRSQNVEKLPTYTHDTEAILTAGDGVGVGKVFHYYKGKFTAHQRVYILSNFKNIESKFLFYYVSINLKNEVSLGGAKSTVDSIRMPMLSNFMVSIPSSTEQHNISNYLDCEIKRIQAMIEIKQNQIENIDKQRQTLIYDYVTGKRRV